MADLAYVLVTIIFFAVVCIIARRADRPEPVVVSRQTTSQEDVDPASTTSRGAAS